jgi:hypothetical protein
MSHPEEFSIGEISATNCVASMYYAGAVCFIGSCARTGGPPITISSADFSACYARSEAYALMIHTENAALSSVIARVNSGAFAVSMYWNVLTMSVDDCIVIKARKKSSAATRRDSEK